MTLGSVLPVVTAVASFVFASFRLLFTASIPFLRSAAYSASFSSSISRSLLVLPASPSSFSAAKAGSTFPRKSYGGLKGGGVWGRRGA